MRTTLLLLLALVVALPATAQQTSTLYEIAYKGTAVTVDADLKDWSDAQWIFLSQDKVNFRNEAGGVIQGVPESPADFSGYFAMKMDDTNIYYAAIVRDEGLPMIDTPADSNVAFNYDHLSVYMGLYDIGDRAGSPHVEGSPGEEGFSFIHPTIADSTIAAGRGYRIGPGTDDSGTTLGSDFQVLFRAIDYGTPNGIVSGDAAKRFHFSGGIMNNTFEGATGATALFADEKGYFLEWSIPLASFAGQISDPARNLADFTWPGFTPEDGKTIVFDADITDLDEGDAPGANRYLRIGDKGALFRDAKSFSMRGKIVDMTKAGNFAPAEPLLHRLQADAERHHRRSRHG